MVRLLIVLINPKGEIKDIIFSTKGTKEDVVGIEVEEEFAQKTFSEFIKAVREKYSETYQTNHLTIVAI